MDKAADMFADCLGIYGCKGESEGCFTRVESFGNGDAGIPLGGGGGDGGGWQEDPRRPEGAPDPNDPNVTRFKDDLVDWMQEKFEDDGWLASGVPALVQGCREIENCEVRDYGWGGGVYYPYEGDPSKLGCHKVAVAASPWAPTEMVPPPPQGGLPWGTVWARIQGDPLEEDKVFVYLECAASSSGGRVVATVAAEVGPAVPYLATTIVSMQTIGGRVVVAEMAPNVGWAWDERTASWWWIFSTPDVVDVRRVMASIWHSTYH